MAHQFDTPADALAHYGVKGMKWGVRKDAVGAADRAPGVSRKVNREASKDAKEFARAKMFYGEGAGTRRKLIKAKVESRSKRSSEYEKAFDHHVSAQDLGKRSTKAVRERKRKDVTNTTKKTTRSTWRALNNGPNVTIAGAVVAAMIVAARRGGLDKIVFDSAKVKYSDAKTKHSNNKAVNDLLKDLGMN